MAPIGHTLQSLVLRSAPLEAAAIKQCTASERGKCISRVHAHAYVDEVLLLRGLYVCIHMCVCVCEPAQGEFED